MTKTTAKKNSRKGKAAFSTDRRRKHHHFLVSVYYADGEKFGRVYTDKGKATRFAERQRRFPVVKSARISQVSCGSFLIQLVFGISTGEGAATLVAACPGVL